MTSFRRYLLGSATMAVLAAMPIMAQAGSYGFASNQISGLLFTDASTGATIALPLNSGSGENISDSAIYGSNSLSGFQSGGAINSAVSQPQAYSGPGLAPAPTYGPVGAGNFTGTRADSSIGAITATGSTVDNVAEGSGTLLGNSQANNTASINFSFTPTSEYALALNFTDLVGLNATSTAGYTASASVQDTFNIVGSNGSSQSYSLFNGSPNSVTSTNGTGTAPINETLNGSFTSATLLTGVTYTITLQSLSHESISPGTSVPVPEPGSLILLGTSLVGLGLVFRGRKSKRS